MAPALSPDQPHSLENGLVKDEYEKRLLHSDVRFRNDNRTLFGYPEEATCGTPFSYSIKTYERTCNRCAALLDIITQHAKERKWREQLKMLRITSQAQIGMAALILHWSAI